jgi:hypothetical protein
MGFDRRCTVQREEAGTAWKFYLSKVYHGTAEFLIVQIANLELVDIPQCCCAATF